MNLELQAYAKEADLIEQHQYAFVKNSSTTIALFRTVDAWKLAIDKRERVVCAFLDLQKAFEVIDHATLLDNLQAYGVHGTHLERMRSYLSDRAQFVSCCGCGSSKREITYGVVQGSVLGPTLFNVHINEITSVYQYCYVALYADDAEVHSSSKDIDSTEEYINRDLKSISTTQVWAHDVGAEAAEIQWLQG